ncbi:endonuclease/exonuclease/phosphatase family protein [Rhodococcus sp. AG1013]|uniref:endonuclease/exonuclease/phosphatase family protein n=1 Tax=unclassified Rhodococcus (in: high G+C Gram-positive bacteria) TaxID=192944 RepID=UPI000E0C732A|nr:endonuclease/exonuclease/phosphatase family protein [Rhodococcus sp. AG1013]RDI32533.1 endonuclease/exonuclease/phosphatase family protein [Rhodococcus sp. AG1013]
MTSLTRRQAMKAFTVAAGTAALGAGAIGTAASAGAFPFQEVRVLSINLWHSGSKIPNGLERVADIIESTRASIVLLSESGDATTALADILGRRGSRFHTATSSDTGILSRFPVEETGALDYMVKAVVSVPGGPELAVYSAHLEYRWYATYLPRGYGGGIPSPGEFSQFGWGKMPGPVTDPDVVQRVNIDSGRPAVISAFLEDAALEREKGRSVIIGGDFNEPSNLDWTAEARDLFDHNGVVLPWESTRLLEQAGYADSYRRMYPNPVTHPGFTWPAGNPDVPVSELTWAPEADERDRIDYIFASRNSRLRLTSAGIVGPRESIVRNERVIESTQDRFVDSPLPWPTDHKAVMATYRCLPALGGSAS